MRQDQLKFFNLEWCSTPAQLPKVLPHFTLKMAEIGQLWRLTAIEPAPTNFSRRRLFVQPNFKGK